MHDAVAVTLEHGTNRILVLGPQAAPALRAERGCGRQSLRSRSSRSTRSTRERVLTWSGSVRKSRCGSNHRNRVLEDELVETALVDDDRETVKVP